MKATSQSKPQNSYQPADLLGDGERSKQLEQLFREWRKMELELAEVGEKDDADASLEESDNKLEAQTVLMNTAAIIRGTTYRDLLFKLAFWRWDAPELESSLDQMKRYDALAYSAFRDLVELTGETVVMTNLDEKTRLLRAGDARQP